MKSKNSIQSKEWSRHRRMGNLFILYNKENRVASVVILISLLLTVIIKSHIFVYVFIPDFERV